MVSGDVRRGKLKLLLKPMPKLTLMLTPMLTPGTIMPDLMPMVDIMDTDPTGMDMDMDSGDVRREKQRLSLLLKLTLLLTLKLTPGTTIAMLVPMPTLATTDPMDTMDMDTLAMATDSGAESNYLSRSSLTDISFDDSPVFTGS